MMRALSWLHYFVQSMRSRRSLRKSDRMHNVLVLYGGRPIAAMEWRAPR